MTGPLQHIRERVSALVYRYGWDTRCRNRCPARALGFLRPDGVRRSGPALLDVGCGRLGLAAFVRDRLVVGSDLQPPLEQMRRFTFVGSSATALPFRDRAFPAVACVDVLEHLSPRDRPDAIKECVRVAAHRVLIAFPSGERSRDCDRAYRQACQRHARPVPEWVEEHLRHEYPVVEAVAAQVRTAAASSGCVAKTRLSYCEPLAISRLVRAAAARSTLLYGLANVFFGMLWPLIPTPMVTNGYRAILLAELSPRDAGA